MTTRKTDLQLASIRRAEQKVKRIPARLRPIIAAVHLDIAEDLERVVRIGGREVSRRVARTVRIERQPGSAGTTLKVVSGGRYRGTDAFFAHLLDGGTAAGFRKYRRRRKGKGGADGFFHPGTRPSGYHRAAYRLRRNEYRRIKNRRIRAALRARS